MAEYFSESAFKRLPVVIQTLPEKERAAFIMMRMRRDESHIARELDIPLTEAQELVFRVRDTLVKEGTIDLVQNPVFYQLDHSMDEDEPSGRTLQVSRPELDPADRLELDRFYRILEQSIAQMPKDGKRLLDLWFNREMKARDILAFYTKIGVPISDKKPLDQTSEQDVFYAIEKNIKNLLSLVRNHIGHDEMEGLTPSTLKAILNDMGI